MPKKLIDYIALVPPQRLFLPGKTHEHLSYRQLHANVTQLSQQYGYLQHKRCALKADSSYSSALLLPVLDNLTSALLLQSSDISQETEQQFYAAAEIEYVIVTHDGEISHVEATGISPKPQQISDECAWLLATSGTTGTPKLMSYSLSKLLSASHKNMAKGEQYRWGLCYEINRFAGLQVYLQCIASGSSLCIPSNQGSFSDILEAFVQHNVNSMSATPSFWRKVLMSPMHQKLKLKNITLGGEISQQAILDALSYAFKNANIQHIYASSEAGVSFSVKDAQAGFPKTYLQENNDVLLKINDDNLWIKSSKQADQFLLGKVNIDDDGFIDTGDVVAIEHDRVLFLGRENGSINVGGNKVMPEKVESALNSHPFVAFSKCYAKTSAMLGALVCADIVLSESASNLSNNEVKQELKAYCKTLLSNFEMPALLKVVETIEMNATGKIIR